MPTNVYFDTGTTSEQRLYENLIIEQLRAFGHDVYYLPRKLVNEDTLFGEDRLSSFNDAYIPLYQSPKCQKALYGQTTPTSPVHVYLFATSGSVIRKYTSEQKSQMCDHDPAFVQLRKT